MWMEYHCVLMEGEYFSLMDRNSALHQVSIEVLNNNALHTLYILIILAPFQWNLWLCNFIILYLMLALALTLIELQMVSLHHNSSLGCMKQFQSWYEQSESQQIKWLKTKISSWRCLTWDIGDPAGCIASFGQSAFVSLSPCACLTKVCRWEKPKLKTTLVEADLQVDYNTYSKKRYTTHCCHHVNRLSSR